MAGKIPQDWQKETVAYCWFMVSADCPALG